MPKAGTPRRADWYVSENPAFYGGLARQLFVDDLVTVTTIKIDEDRDGLFTDETALAATDYELLPRNAADGPEPAPYTTIELTPWGTKYAFPTGCRVEVVGIFGWPAVPQAIVRACCHLTAILRLDSARATGRIMELDNIYATSREAQTIVGELMMHYGRGPTF